MAGFEPPGPGQPPEEPAGSPPTQPPYYPPQYPAYGAPQPPNHSQELIRAESSRKMAGWGLGLSLLLCVPLVPVVGIVLGIVVLARSKGAPNHGRGNAIAAVVIGGLYVLVLIGFFVFGVVEAFQEDFDDDEAGGDSSSEVDAGDNVLPSKLREGDCFNEPRINDIGPTEQFEATTVEVVLCKVPHDAEVFHAFQMPDGDFPGEDAINRQSLTCAKEFTKFVGRPYTRSDLDFIYYFPTEDSWDILDDHGITCSIFDPKGKVSGTLARSRR